MVNQTVRKNPGVWVRVGWLLLAVVAAFVTTLSPQGTSAKGSVVTLYVDGVKQNIVTSKETVREVLTESNIVLHQHDLVEPIPEAEVLPGNFHINVYRAKPVLIVDGEVERIVESSYQSPRLVVQKSAGITLYPEDRVEVELVRDFVGDQLIGFKVDIERATPINLKIDGGEFVVRTHATSVAEFMAETGIKLSGEDFIRPAPDTVIAADQSIEVVRVGYEIIAEEQLTPRTVRQIRRSDQPTSWREVQEEGQDGRVLNTFRVKRHNQTEVERELLQTLELAQAVEQVVLVGTRYSGDAWADLRFCEAGGDYTRNSGNGYYGAYQFNLSTWGSNAPAGWGDTRPDLAPPEIQDQAAQNLQSRRGWGPWPACARKLGLPL